MRFDLLPPDGWNTYCDRYRAALPLPQQDAGTQVQIYRGYQHALLEASQGLAKLYSHKKTIAIIGDFEPAFEPIAVAFSSEGYTVKMVPLNQVSDIETWFEPIQSDLLFAIYAIDDPLTGRIYDNEAPQKAMSGKRIFQITLSHALHKWQLDLDKPAPFEVRIKSLHPERALVIAGERFRVNPILAPFLPWSFESDKQIEIDLEVISGDQADANRQTILQFEQKLPQPFQRYFSLDANRLFDRALFFSTEFDGSAVIAKLAKRIKLQVSVHGVSGPFESTSPCRWGNPRFTDWLLKKGEDEATVRGLIALDVKILVGDSSESILTHLSEVASEIRLIQNG